MSNLSAPNGGHGQHSHVESHTSSPGIPKISNQMVALPDDRKIFKHDLDTLLKLAESNGLPPDKFLAAKTPNANGIELTGGIVTKIDYGCMNLTTLEGISELSGLKDIAIGHTKIKSLASLRSNILLEHISAQFLGLTEIEVTRHLPNLKTLYLCGNLIADFSPLSHHEGIDFIHAQHNPYNEESVALLTSLKDKGTKIHF